MKKLFGALVALQCLAGIASAASYPDHPITIYVTAAPGGVTDVVARALGEQMTKDWGQPVVIVNRGGAGHVLGEEAVAKAPPDGYTLMVAESGSVVINPLIYPPGKLPFDTEKDFVPIAGLVRINQAILANRTLPVSNAAELIALAKKQPDTLTYGTAGIGSAPHMNMALFESMAGVKFVAVHYRGAAPALNDVRSGSINLMSVSVSLALPAYRAGEIRILGVGSLHRLPQAPEIPTVAESGLPGYQAVAWFGLFGPAAAPSDVVAKLNGEVEHVFNDPAFRTRFLDPQMFESIAGPQQQFADFIKAERTKWSKVIKEANITLE
jgi:tripartite-type tricarboxylate transporter receptor subunit TctC